MTTAKVGNVHKEQMSYMGAGKPCSCTLPPQRMSNQQQKHVHLFIRMTSRQVRRSSTHVPCWLMKVVRTDAITSALASQPPGGVSARPTRPPATTQRFAVIALLHVFLLLCPCKAPCPFPRPPASPPWSATRSLPRRWSRHCRTPTAPCSARVRQPTCRNTHKQQQH